MADRWPSLASLPDAELEDALFEVGRRLGFPDTVDLAGRVRGQIQRDPVGQPATLAALPVRRTSWLAVAALILLLLGLLALIPETRTAIADRFGLPGVVIRWLDSAPPAPATPVGTRLMLGQPVTIEEARIVVGYPIQAPTLEGFAEPPEIYLLGGGNDAMVSFVYPPRPGLAEDELSGVGALLTQFPGRTNPNFVEKGLRGDEGQFEQTVEMVEVNGDTGFWIAGAPHGFFLTCSDDEHCREERYRLAGNVLLWVQDDLTLRFESALSREEALAVAVSVRTVE